MTKPNNGNNFFLEDRPDYQTSNRARLEADATRVITLLDSILEIESTSCDRREYTTDPLFKSHSREFTYNDSGPFGHASSLVRKRVGIDYLSNRSLGVESYQLSIGWFISTGVGRLITQYSIEKYPKGYTQTQIIQPDVITGKYDVRPIASFDYHQIEKELGELSLLGHIEHDMFSTRYN